MGNLASVDNYYIDCCVCGKHVKDGKFYSLAQESIINKKLQDKAEVENVFCKECGERIQSLINYCPEAILDAYITSDG